MFSCYGDCVLETMSFRKLDIYSKTVDGVTTQTRIGGGVTIVAIVLISFLIFSNVFDYFQQDIVSRMVVDSAAAKNVIIIRFNIDFPQLPCSSKLLLHVL